MTRISEIANMIVNYNVPISSIFVMILFTLPRFLEFSIPLSVTIAILLTFLRMSEENEILALKAGGMTLYKLLPPVLVFCLIGTLLSLWITVFAMPWARLSFRLKTIEFAQSSMDMAIQERQFNSQIAGLMIYVSHVDINTGTLSDVFIEDRRKKGLTGIYTAPSGRLIGSEGGKIYTLRLYNGMINQVAIEKNSVNHINFGQYDLVIDLAKLNKPSAKTDKELDERDLLDLIRHIRKGITDNARLNKALMELHEKFSVPFACLFLGILAFSLGIQSNVQRRSSGVGLGIFFFLVYYILLAAGWSIGETGAFPPILSMWFPNIVMGISGGYLLTRKAREKPVNLPKFVVLFLTALKSFLPPKK
jgi:lipopolysaccharide export system permease protein